MFVLLQRFLNGHRFIQWREENLGVSEGVVKKVPHCNLCRHPGSAKAHERGGCSLCNSQRFCQPQDFDYQCPCDWHRYDRHSITSVKSLFFRKTLASQQFPFTEIISEFLVSKDKPVSHFKRRQPNMLLMQKFAFDKMEWPKHYTSEKVLVLMTYTALMNRKYGREMTSQIKPIRILKPRVRNAIACFEVIWSTPEHYVFPEDRPAEDQHEVRTVEEESLFRVAYPEVVESYLRNKALAEENKTKSKTTIYNIKKEKPSEVSDGISDLLAQMTLKSVSAQPETLIPTISNTDEPEVIILDTPVSQKQHRKENEDSSLHDYPKVPLSHAESEAAASPSVSAVIDALHLSDIDWEALSFTSSPTPQAAANHTTQPQLNKATDSHVRKTEGEDTKHISGDVKEGNLCYTECPLRDRLLMRNMAKSMNQVQVYNDVVPEQLNYVLPTIEYSSKLKPDGQVFRKGNYTKLSGKESAVHNNEPLTYKTQSSKELLKPTVQAQNKTNETSNGSKKPPQKYKFVRTAISSSTVPPQRCHSDPGQGTKTDMTVPQTIKRSVCMSVCSSSEDSDVENQQSGPQRQTKTKSTNKIKGSFSSDLPLKLVFIPKTNKPAAKASHSHQVASQSHRVETENGTPASAKTRCQDVPPASVDDDVFLQAPASPITVLDSDDSVICSESPLPLAERLRLKFLK
uniref:Flap endonuclease GEN chromatin organization modifier domain-containing protein n=1 Tax=Amphiprion percula TaxID=161767 RepID=A0A3P8TC67_AMPPE